MQTYSREFTDDEVFTIGVNGYNKIDRLISSFISATRKGKNATTSTSRVLALIHDHPVTATDVLDAYQAVHGSMYPISITYVRKIMHDLYSAGIIKRVSHGKYVRGDN